MEAVDSGTWFQTEFDGEPWTQAVHDPITGSDYKLYRRPDGSTVSTSLTMRSATVAMDPRLAE